jgi:hypothetical protein
MAREVPNFNFMDITQQFVFLMINEDINIISFISDIVFENFQMREKMVWYVESPIARRSCETQLLTLTHELAKSLDSGIQQDPIILDFSKAFDKVPH